MRNIYPLNFNWQYSPEFRRAYIEESFDDSNWQRVDIPHSNVELPYNNFDERSYQFVSCYRKQLFVDANQRGQRAILTFQGVMLSCEVFLNGTKVGEHKGGYTPFSIDITHNLNYGSNNQLVVMVDSRERPEVPPFGHVVDFLTYGGIYREVELTFCHPVSIKDCFVQTRDVTQANKLLRADIALANTANTTGEATLHFQLWDSEQKGLSHQFEQRIALDGSSSQMISIEKRLSDVLPWSLNSPRLYRLQTSLSLAGEVVDQKSTRFGFREVVISDQGFFLNGEKIKLRGLNRHQSFPYVGYAMPASAQARDAEILKQELGVNMVRFSHYPQSDHFLDRCDELGLLVFDEIPGWQHVSDTPEWQALVLQQTREMIEKDRNHPSIVIWGVRINESPDADSLYQQTNKLAHQLDPTRPTGGVRCIKNSNLLEDVYTYNDFVHTGDNQPLDKQHQVVGKQAPYLVTEHNGHMFPTKRFDNQARLAEHALRHLRVLNAMYGDPHISGALGWCMFDYNTHKDFGSGDRICYHGVLDMFRQPKYAAAAYAMQQDDKPVMEVASNMLNGDYNGAQFGSVYLLTNCDYVKLYKNGELLGHFYPATDEFPHLPHAPIILDDFMGEQLERDNRFSPKDCAAIRELFRLVNRHGADKLSLPQKLKALWVMKKNHLSQQDMVDLFIKYIGSWGAEAVSYRVEGFRGGKQVIVRERGQSKQPDLRVQADSHNLKEAATYDVTRVVVDCVDEFGTALNYENSPLKISVDGAARLIGPAHVSLTGGTVAFWVRSIGKAGEATLLVDSPRFGRKSLIINTTIEPIPQLSNTASQTGTWSNV